jgi:alkylhydroperoxidase family enzyme
LIRKQEKELGASLEWMRDVADTSLPALFKSALVTPFGNHRRYLPKDAWHVARLATTLTEDCGTCAQIVVNLALKDGVSPGILYAVIRGQPENLPENLRTVQQFASMIAAGQDDSALRELLLTHFRDEGIVELAIAIATSRLIPTLKRAMGHSQSCFLTGIAVAEERAERRG